MGVTIFMVEDLFRMKEIDKKWDIVRRHYEKTYHMKFKKRPDNKIILNLYRQMKALGLAERAYLRSPSL